MCLKIVAVKVSGKTIPIHILVLILAVFGMILTSASVSGQHPLKEDTDGDGMPDGWEVEHGLNPNYAGDASFDYNYNGLTNFQEYENNSDPWDKDSDDDGISNYAECWGLFGFFTDPFAPDTDEDGLSDLEEICQYINLSDETQMKEIYTNETDRVSAKNSIIRLCRDYPYKLDPINSDVDGDGLNDGNEIFRDNKTNPNYIDSDYDGLSDGDEVHKYKTEPTKRDTDGDGLLDSEEIFGTYGVVTDPTKRDTDGDGISDGEEILGFGFAPIEPSRHALTYEEFINGAYGGEYITLKAMVDKIRYHPDLNSYLIFLNPLELEDGAEGKHGVARVNSSWHYEFDYDRDMVHVDDRFEFALREGDTIVIVGKAGGFLGSTREIEVDSGGKMFLVLSPEEANERWLPSKDYVKIISSEHKMRPVNVTSPPRSSPAPAPAPTPTLSPVPNSSQTPTLTPSPSLSPVSINKTNVTNSTASGDFAGKPEGKGIFGLLIYVVIGIGIVTVVLLLFIRNQKKREEGVKSFWVVSDMQNKGNHTYEVVVNREGEEKEARIELNEKLYKRLIKKKRLVLGKHTILIP